MRYAILTDVHANLEALQAVLAKIDEIANEEPIDQMWFLGDLVGYGPDPNECIRVLRERTDVMIAGNHDWAAVGKIDLEDFSAAARVSAEWTAEQLTPEHRDFLINLPERLEIDGCTLVHGSPFGPLWEYLTSEALAERSFLYFDTRYCLVGHTHIPAIFIQPDAANIPTLPLSDVEQAPPVTLVVPDANARANGANNHHEQTGDSDAHDEAHAAEPPAVKDSAGDASEADDDDETVELVMAGQQSTLAADSLAEPAASAYQEPRGNASPSADSTDTPGADTPDDDETETAFSLTQEDTPESQVKSDSPATDGDDDDDATAIAPLDYSAIRSFVGAGSNESEEAEPDAGRSIDDESIKDDEGEDADDDEDDDDAEVRTPAGAIANAEERLTSEIEELLSLLGLSQSMVEVTNQMLTPPEGPWELPPEHRAIINPGGVGQPRDGDP
ncbi:MAG TPA: metallophosphoesterase family protein, partial [Ktedonobacteraceae bacterium]|nr:metallophosphoesterase family protein [Ktedonobacteraceae bacterium]